MDMCMWDGLLIEYGLNMYSLLLIAFSLSLVSLCVSLSLCLSLCLSLSVSLSFGPSLFLSVSLSLCLCLSVSVSLSLCLSLRLAVSFSLSLTVRFGRITITQEIFESETALVSCFRCRVRYSLMLCLALSDITGREPAAINRLWHAKPLPGAFHNDEIKVQQPDEIKAKHDELTQKNNESKEQLHAHAVVNLRRILHFMRSDAKLKEVLDRFPDPNGMTRAELNIFTRRIEKICLEMQASNDVMANQKLGVSGVYGNVDGAVVNFQAHTHTNTHTRTHVTMNSNFEVPPGTVSKDIIMTQCHNDNNHIKSKHSYAAKSPIKHTKALTSNSSNHFALPISVFNNVNDVSAPKPFRYIHNSFSELEWWKDAGFVWGCQCTDNCSNPQRCDCIKSSTGRYSKDGKLRPSDESESVKECNALCPCGSSCRNRLIQTADVAKKYKLQLFMTKKTGWGLRTLSYIPKDSFVIEYVGEIITSNEAESRGVAAERLGCTYLFDLSMCVYVYVYVFVCCFGSRLCVGF